MNATLFIALSLIIGLLLLFFGLKFVKLAATLMGFLLGFAIMSALGAGFGWPDVTNTVVAIVAGIVAAMVAFAFYKLAVTVSASVFFGSLALGLMQSWNVANGLDWGVAVAAGVAVFLIITTLKLVDVFFALSTALQGAGFVTMAIYATIYPAAVALLDSTDGVARASFFAGSWWWLLIWLVLALVGFSFQLKTRPADEQ